MIPMRDENGRRSRTADTGQVLLLAGMVQAALSVNGIPIPLEWQWVQGVALALLGQWIIYLRMNTTTKMGS